MQLYVTKNGKLIGILAETSDGVVTFKYSDGILHPLR